MESPPTGTVTFLFTDIEGSTLRWQDEPEAMRALLAEHDAIWRDVIDKRHGWLSSTPVTVSRRCSRRRAMR